MRYTNFFLPSYPPPRPPPRPVSQTISTTLRLKHDKENNRRERRLESTRNPKRQAGGPGHRRPLQPGSKSRSSVISPPLRAPLTKGPVRFQVGVVAPRAHRARTVATISGHLPDHHPTMYPPKQPIEPQKTSDASTPPVFRDFSLWLTMSPRGFWMVFVLSWRPLGSCNDHREGPQIPSVCTARAPWQQRPNSTG